MKKYLLSAALIRHLQAYSIMMTSDLSFIQIKDPTNPVPLYQEWLDEAKQHGAHTSLMNLATATRNGKVSNRTLVIREVMPDGSLAFTAQAKSRKIKEITENPQVAATVLLLYTKDGKNLSRQIRISGTAEKLPAEQCKIYFEKEPLSAKIRSWICQDGGPAEWENLKTEHDQMLREVQDGQVLRMPETQVAYKIIPNEVDFSFSEENQIADRVAFKLVNQNWQCTRQKA